MLFFVSLFFFLFPVLCSCFCLAASVCFLFFDVCCVFLYMFPCFYLLSVFYCCVVSVFVYVFLFCLLKSGVFVVFCLFVFLFFLCFVPVSVWGVIVPIRYAWTHHVMLYHAWVAPLAGCLRYQ